MAAFEPSLLCVEEAAFMVVLEEGLSPQAPGGKKWAVETHSQEGWVGVPVGHSGW